MTGSSPIIATARFVLAFGVTPAEMLMQAVGAAEDPASGGRQMPSHWGHAEHNIVSSSSPTGTQFLNAVGCAEGGRKIEELGLPAAAESDEVVYVSSGEGTTSQGEFFEALNCACNLKLPVLFHIQDNEYAISVPVEVNTAGGSISRLVSGFPNLLIVEFDGCDPEESLNSWKKAAEHARSGKGPVLLHAHVTRPYSHSLSDDERAYRTTAELDRQSNIDPIISYRTRLASLADISEDDLKGVETEVAQVIAEAKEEALAALPPAADTAEDFAFSPDVDPTSDDFDTEPLTAGSDRTMVDLINDCLRDEMKRNKGIVIFGEDVADASREENLEHVKGKGGVFKVTHGLQRAYGSNRVYNSQLAEATIIGRAVGMAVRGVKPRR